ncbi:MAG: FHA domain-containing protein [Akkermansia sp.]
MSSLKQQTESVAQLQAQLSEAQLHVQVLKDRLKLQQDAILQTRSFSSFSKDADAPPVLLRRLSASDPLVSKWHLGAGLPPVQALSRAERQSSMAMVQPPAARGSMHLFGLLSTGLPWQYTVKMSEVEAGEGLIIGRAKENADIVLDDAGVSRAHARFALMHGVLVISDLGSTNGIEIDGEAQPMFESNIPIFDGMVIGLGPVHLRLEILD